MSKETLIKSTYRVKDAGEVYTPSHLASELYKRAVELRKQNAKAKFIDPQCGSGNLLIPVIEGKLQQGCTPWEALSTTFGVDIMADNVKECRQRLMEAAGVTEQKYVDLLKTTIVRGNTLEDSMEDLFSRYQEQYGNNTTEAA